MIVYDYANNPVEVVLPDKPITAIDVSVLSGDETGTVFFADGTHIRFDSSGDRLIGFDDGSYYVEGDAIQKWLDFKPSEDRTASYERQSLFSNY